MKYKCIVRTKCIACNGSGVYDAFQRANDGDWKGPIPIKCGSCSGKGFVNAEIEQSMPTAMYTELAQRTDGTCTVEGKILNAALGLAGEAGEFADHIKKYQFQGHDLDKDHLIKELGDILWYVAQAAVGLETTIDEIMERNINKLKARYPDGFEAERSRNREV